MTPFFLYFKDSFYRLTRHAWENCFKTGTMGENVATLRWILNRISNKTEDLVLVLAALAMLAAAGACFAVLAKVDYSWLLSNSKGRGVLSPFP